MGAAVQDLVTKSAVNTPPTQLIRRLQLESVTAHPSHCVVRNVLQFSARARTSQCYRGLSKSEKAFGAQCKSYIVLSQRSK